ncbi:MAG: hypothetical protein GKR98_17445 [Boseongicola sp.]|nr:MAG: hypothetical protein GKR98_17445 [Boseongicola sp.]
MLKITSPTEREITEIKAVFQSDWYGKIYSRHLAALKKRNETNFDFYIRTGARLGHEPHPGFSELLYRNRNPDIWQEIMRGSLAFGFVHWLRAGLFETSRKYISDDDIVIQRRIAASIDLNVIEKKHPQVYETV